MKNALLLIFLFLTRLGNAQDTLFLKGKIVDEEQLFPISNATIQIGDNQAISDKLGLFSIIVLSNQLHTNGINISASGFQKLHLTDINDSSFLYLTLSPLVKSYSDNVSVTFGGKDIIRRVYENISKNYETHAFNQTVIQFTQTHIDDTVYSLNDLAELKLYNSGLDKKKNSFQIQLLQNKQLLKDFPIEVKESKENMNWYLIGAYELFPKSDVVFNNYSFLDTSHWNNYAYKLMSKTKWKNRSVYPIRFNTIDSAKAGIEGVVMIDSATYAVIHVNMHSNWEMRQEMAKRNKGTDFFDQNSIQYYYDGKYWKLESVHLEGYQIRSFKKKNHQFDFIEDIINYPKTYPSVEKIPFFKRVIHSAKLSSFNTPGTDESWKPILDFIHTDSFRKEFPWINLSLFGF
ncbi:MAG: hypothetical protein DI598_02180 [Pseudopedobacter saltans]|uniref:Carboxypeptidase-like regulatory domain-containing protein n=1 Tax=Pseudopedobacter saltans TaxID=151895 RepID=A0A2W5FDX6_9SPHI|nr:MAG: hypothetical protein DI598_02180 [Pseudopedobacter saltans]